MRMTMKRKNNDRHKMTGKLRFIRTAAAVCAAMTVALSTPLVSLADLTATVTVESAKIRGSADTSSNVVGSVARGSKLKIREEVTDASGKVWYQVELDANTTGYVRGDLVEKEGSSESSSQQVSDGGSGSEIQADGAGEEPSGASVQAETPMDAQYASVSVEAAKIRSAPSTNDSVVERLEKDAQLIVRGQSKGSSDGKEWYYVTFTGADGVEKAGFVRSDLVTLGDMVPPPAEEPEVEEPEAPEPEQTVSQDYEVAFKDGEWYLIDNLGGYEQKLQPLLDANKIQKETMDEDAKKLVRQRIAIVVLAAVAVILVIVVVIMAVKLRDAYYEDYEDDEDEEDEEEQDEEEEELVRRRKRSQEENPAKETGRPQRRAVREEEPVRRPSGRSTEIRGSQETESRGKSVPKRKAKNFLLDDDEFEFEFLNMDDKDI